MTSKDEFAARLMARAEELLDQHRDEFLSVEGNEPRHWESWREIRTLRRRSTIQQWAGRLPALWRDARLTDLESGQHAAKIIGYLDGPARNLILAGPVGTGKSYAAFAVANEATASGRTVRAWSVPRLLVDMRPEGDRAAFQDACGADLLVLDDLGAAKPTDWATEQIYSIAEDRCSNRRHTVITTNSTFDQLVTLWGSPTMDRFRDLAISVDMPGRSRRGMS